LVHACQVCLVPPLVLRTRHYLRRLVPREHGCLQRGSLTSLARGLLGWPQNNMVGSVCRVGRRCQFFDVATSRQYILRSGCRMLRIQNAVKCGMCSDSLAKVYLFNIETDSGRLGTIRLQHTAIISSINSSLAILSQFRLIFIIFGDCLLLATAHERILQILQ